MLIDNINFLRKRFRSVREQLKEVEEQLEMAPIEVEKSRSGVSTLTIEKEGKHYYIHSSYDPVREAENIAKKYDDISSYNHIFFYGIGFGYHVETVLEQFPRASFSLYEPEPFVCAYFLNERIIEKVLPVQRLRNFYLESNEADTEKHIADFFSKSQDNVLLVVLPSYERLFYEAYERFLKIFTKRIKSTRTDIQTNLAFEKRWTANSIINFPEVVRTPNFLQDVDHEHLKGKPTLIVAAGPSLNEEIEHIRTIKEQGLAYIFTVGSAINTLVYAGIYPDAAFTYDPTEKNQIVFEKLKEENITEIPLVFGSSVGYETLQNYPSEKRYHMITSQDTISPFYLVSKDSESIEGVFDAPSIAVVTLQALFRIGCLPIVLVGQNLGYRGNDEYAQGISYATKVEDAIKKLTVESVDGSTIYTNDEYLHMKQQLELYIARIPNGQVINTTKQGAKIEGAKFKPLDEVMNSFKEGTVTDSWLDAKPSYSYSHVAEKVDEMELATEQFEALLSKLVEGIVRMEQLAETMQAKELIKIFDTFDQTFARFQQNRFYEVVIKPMVRVQADLTHKKVQNIRFNNDPVEKGVALVQAIGPFLYACQQDAKMIAPAYHWMVNELKKITTEKVQAE